MKENEKINEYLDLGRELKKAVEPYGDGDTSNSWRPWNSFYRP